MFSKPAAIALVAGACVISAVAGAYIALETGALRGASQSQTTSAGTPASQNQPSASPVESAAPLPPVRPAEGASLSAEAGKDASVPSSLPEGETVSRPSSARAKTVPLTKSDRAKAADGGPQPAAAPEIKPGGADRELSPPIAQPPVTQQPPAIPVTGPPAAAEAVSQERAPMIEELVVPSDAVLGLQIETTISSERAKVEDQVEARVVRMVLVGGRVAIPEGTRVVGSVTHLERGGKVKGQAKLTVRFHTLVLADGTLVQIKTDPVFRDGVEPGKGAAQKIGGAAIGGALLGALLGGGKGAAIGGAIGAAGGTAATMSSDRSEAVLQAGTAITVRLLSPVSIVVDR